MRDGCWHCKKWEEHFYWSHFEESNFRFLKVMDGDFSQQMEFPLKFSKNFRVDLIHVVSLKLPTGQSWEMGLQKEQDHFYLTGGWKQFIEENQIEQDQTLIFEYTGDSSFMVQIFDQTGLLRGASDLVIDARAEKKKADRTFVKFQISNSSEVRYDSPMLLDVSDIKPTLTTRACEADRQAGCSRICIQEHNDLDSDSSSETNDQDTVKALQLKLAGKQSKSSFVKIIKRSNLLSNPYMTIPAKFLSEHIPRKPYGITICNPSNKKWFVYCKWMNTAWGFYGKSLFNLIQENKLKEGDACVFKLKEKKLVVMGMSIVLAEEVDSILKNSWS